MDNWPLRVMHRPWSMVYCPTTTLPCSFTKLFSSWAKGKAFSENFDFSVSILGYYFNDWLFRGSEITQYLWLCILNVNFVLKKWLFTDKTPLKVAIWVFSWAKWGVWGGFLAYKTRWFFILCCIISYTTKLFLGGLFLQKATIVSCMYNALATQFVVLK